MIRLLVLCLLLIVSLPATVAAVTSANVAVNSATNGVEIVSAIRTWARVQVDPAGSQSVYIGVYDDGYDCTQAATPDGAFGELFPPKTGWAYYRSQLGAVKKLCAILPAAGSVDVGVRYE
jgi:hypothetical protein